MDALDWHLQRAYPRHRLQRHRSREHVASENDQIDVCGADVFEHGIERGQIGVNVVQYRHARRRRHAGSISPGGSAIPTTRINTPPTRPY
jgi:hypothetical protein